MIILIIIILIMIILIMIMIIILIMIIIIIIMIIGDLVRPAPVAQVGGPGSGGNQGGPYTQFA